MNEFPVVPAPNDMMAQQLNAYAEDLRRTFAAEKRRAEELAAALVELKQTYFATVHGLAAAVEAKDEYTSGHLVRVTRYGLRILREIAPDEVDDPMYEYGFLLHDIGKLGVADSVLNKEGPLDEPEWMQMRMHPEIGQRIIGDIPFLAGAKEIVYSHHERWDGGGYPAGLKGEQIMLGARVFPVADSFDAMTSHRPYRDALSIEEAISRLIKSSGTQFWPEAVEAFAAVPHEELLEIQSLKGLDRHPARKH